MGKFSHDRQHRELNHIVIHLRSLAGIRVKDSDIHESCVPLN